MLKRIIKGSVLVGVSLLVLILSKAPIYVHADNSVTCPDGAIIVTTGMSPTQVDHACDNHSALSSPNSNSGPGVTNVDLSCTGSDTSECERLCKAAEIDGYAWVPASFDGSTPGFCRALTSANVGGTNCEDNCISKDVQTFINFASAGVGVIVLAMIIIGGIQYSLSKDNPQAVQAAKARIANSVIAMLCFIFLYAFLQWLVPGGIF